MKKAVLSLSILSALAAPSVFAQDDSSFYVGGRVGAHFFDTECFRATEKCDRSDNSSVAGGAILGYDFGNNFAIEGTFDYLGDVATGTRAFKGNDRSSGDLTMFTLAPKLDFSLTERTDLYGKVGAAWWQADLGAGKLDDVGYLGALGLDHRVNDLINLRAEYQYTGGIDKRSSNANGAGFDFEGDSHFVSVGATLHFGRTSQAPVVVEEEVYEAAPVVNEVLVPELFSSVQFAFDRDELDSEAIALLQPTLQRLQDIPESTAVVSGYTDNIGSEEYNEVLSLERAQTVAEYFSSNGIDARRMIIQGLGESSPIATNNNAEGRRMNRRVEVYSPELVVVEEQIDSSELVVEEQQ